MGSDETNVSDKIEILSTEDEKIKAIGEILASDSSRKILQLLFNQSFTANQLAQKTEMSLPLVIHHLKKMQSTGVVKITNIGKNTKSHDMKFYTIDKVALVILPTAMSQPAKKSKSLFNSFNRIHRLATLGGVSAAAWFSLPFLQKSSTTTVIPDEYSRSSPEPAMAPAPFSSVNSTGIAKDVGGPPQGLGNSTVESITPTTGEPTVDLSWPIIVVVGIIATGLAIEIWIHSRHKKNPNMQK